MPVDTAAISEQHEHTSDCAEGERQRRSALKIINRCPWLTSARDEQLVLSRCGNPEGLLLATARRGSDTRPMRFWHIIRDRCAGFGGRDPIVPGRETHWVWGSAV